MSSAESHSQWQILEHSPNNNAQSSTTITSRNNNRDSGDDNNQIANNDIVYKIYGYSTSRTRQLLYHILAWIPFLGLFHLLAFWLPKIRLWKYKKSPLSISDHVLCK